MAVSWRNVVATASSLAEKPGVPADWARQLQGLFGQLQSVVQAMESAAAAHDGADQTTHNEQMRQQQLEQQQLQAQLMQQQQVLREQGILPQLQPQQQTLPAVVVQCAEVSVDSSGQPRLEHHALAPTPPPPPQPPQTHCEPVSAEDMVARAMGMSAANGAAVVAEGGTTGGGETSETCTANANATTAGAQDDGLDDGSDSDADEMAGVEVEVREGESVEQHRTRVRRLFKEKLQRAKAAKDSKEDRKGNKPKDSKESKEKARPKASHKK